MTVNLGTKDARCQQLLEDWRTGNVEVRVNAVRKLSATAKDVGPERTRNELLELLSGVNPEEDESILLILLKELRGLVDLVGGPEYVHILLPFMERLAATDNITVKKEVVECVGAVVTQLAPEYLERYFVPMIKRLSLGFNRECRAFSCRLYGMAYSGSTPERKEILQRWFMMLCGDRSADVRDAAAAGIAELCSVMEKDYLRTRVLGNLVTLAKDQKAHVRIQAMKSFPAIVPVLHPEEVEAQLLPLLEGMIASGSMWGRVVACNAKSKIALPSRPPCTSPQALPAVVGKRKETEATPGQEGSVFELVNRSRPKVNIKKKGCGDAQVVPVLIRNALQRSPSVTVKFEGRMMSFELDIARLFFPKLLRDCSVSTWVDISAGTAFGLVVVYEATVELHSSGYVNNQLSDVIHKIWKNFSAGQLRRFATFIAIMDADPETVAQIVVPLGLFILSSAAPGIYVISNWLAEWLAALLMSLRVEAALRITEAIGLPGLTCVIIRQFCLCQPTKANFMGGGTAEAFYQSVLKVVQRYMRNAIFFHDKFKRYPDGQKQKCFMDSALARMLYPGVRMSLECYQMMSPEDVSFHTNRVHFRQDRDILYGNVKRCGECGIPYLTHAGYISNCMLTMEHRIRCVGAGSVPRFLAEWHRNDGDGRTTYSNDRLQLFVASDVHLSDGFTLSAAVLDLAKCNARPRKLHVEYLDEKEAMILME